MYVRTSYVYQTALVFLFFFVGGVTPLPSRYRSPAFGFNLIIFCYFIGRSDKLVYKLQTCNNFNSGRPNSRQIYGERDSLRGPSSLAHWQHNAVVSCGILRTSCRLSTKVPSVSYSTTYMAQSVGSPTFVKTFCHTHALQLFCITPLTAPSSLVFLAFPAFPFSPAVFHFC